MGRRTTVQRRHGAALAHKRAVPTSSVLRTAILGGGVLALLGCSNDAPTNPSARAAIAPPTAASAKSSNTGVLNLCKQAGPGITPGQSFSFAVSWPGVSKTVSVAAGSCATVSVSFDVAPLGKGYFAANPAVVAALLPSGTSLSIGGATLTSADVQAILNAAPNVQTPSAVVLTLVEQVIAADLNAMRGLQPPSQVAQAISDANAGLKITNGAQIQIATTLTTAQVGALTTTITSFNDGKLKLAALTSFNAAVTETTGPFNEVSSITCDPVSQCSGIDLAAGRVTAVVTSGGTTKVTYTNRALPVLRICKVAGAGLQPGATYTFLVTAPQMPITIFTGPAGLCGEAIMPAVTFNVAEVSNPPGVVVSALTCDPATRCSGADLTLGTVQVQLERGITTVTYTNRQTLGTLRVCTQGIGVLNGTFDITVSGPGDDSKTATILDLLTEDCQNTTLLEGTYLVAETFSEADAPTVPSAVTCDPTSRCSDVNVPNGRAHATVVAGSTTTVTVTNRSTLGQFSVCGFFPGSTSEIITLFDVTSVETGESQILVECDGVATLLAEGYYTVTERPPLPEGWALSQITCGPNTQCSNVSVASSTVTARVIVGSPVAVTFVHTVSTSLNRTAGPRGTTLGAAGGGGR